MENAAIFALILGSVLAVVGWLWRRSLQAAYLQAELAEHAAAEKLAISERSVADLNNRFRDVLDLDEEKSKVLSEIEEVKVTLSNLKEEYALKKDIYDRLREELAIYDERLSFAELGVYEPHFDFTDSESYKEQIAAVRLQQKELISNKTAVTCNTVWSLNGNTAQGKTMINRGVRLTLRAFNNECDAAIANTRWNNVNAMEKRIVRASEQIDKLNESNHIVISDKYVWLKIQELFLTHEYRERLKLEREDKAEALRLAREEQKLLRDMENAIAEEERYKRLLEAAKLEAHSIVGPKLEVFEAQIAKLERDLEAAHLKVARAQAMAERTRSGYVYIISNIGSFGEGVVKIGLTRRLDPMDRVKELGDASVPFVFDTHAMIYSDDAPSLEKALHTEFDSNRINAQNYRKEFFRASIEEVENAVKQLAPEALFYRDIEAQEYRETLSRRQRTLSAELAGENEIFPASL